MTQYRLVCHYILKLAYTVALILTVELYTYNIHTSKRQKVLQNYAHQLNCDN